VRNDTPDAFRTVFDRLSAAVCIDPGTADGELLRRFRADADEAAFAELVRRHGGRVAGVCRRWLGDPGRADDASQAVFLLLARKAGRLSGVGSLAGWLHAAAVHIARNAKRADARRATREKQAAKPERVAPADPTWAEVRRHLDAELARLPQKYRDPLVLCFLDGLGQAEAARKLGIAEGVFRGRLDRGRAKLRTRLERLGLGAALLAVPTADALTVPTLAAVLTVVRQDKAGEAVSAAVSALLPRSHTVAGMAAGAASLIAVVTSLVLVVVGQPAKPPTAADDSPPAKSVRLGRPQYPLKPDTSDRPHWLADGRTVLTATASAVVWLEPATGHVVRTWPLPTGCELVGANADGPAVCLTDGTRLAVWNPATGKKTCELTVAKPDTARRSVEFSPDGATVLVRDAKTVRAFDAKTGVERWADVNPSLDPARGWVGVRADGSVLATAANGEVRVLDPNTGRKTGELSVPGDASKYRLTPDGRQLWAATSAGVRAWDAATGAGLRSFGVADGRLQSPRRFAVTADGTRLAVADVDGVDSGKLLLLDPAKPTDSRSVPLAWAADVELMEFTPDGKTLLLARHGERAPRLFDAATGKETSPPSGSHLGPLVGVCPVSADRVATAGLDRTLRVWDAATGKELAAHPLTGANTLAALTPLGDDRVVTADHYPGTLAVREWKTGKTVRTLDPGCYVTTLAASADGTRIAVAGRVVPKDGRGSVGVFVLLDAATGKTVARHDGFDPHSVALSADGKRVIVGCADGVRVLTEGDAAPVHRKGEAVRAVAISADGKWFAVATADAVRVTDADGKPITSITTRNAVAVALSADGTRLAWNEGAAVFTAPADTGKPALPLRGHDDSVRSLTFSSDGTRLLSAAADGTAFVWPLSADSK
jgi:RNA polymerase sigma factor (sigma-70 family)